jgi:serine/threonine-protein kinase
MQTRIADFPDAKANRVLLFSLLAHRLSLLSREDLVNVMRTWALDKSRPLEQILAEHGILSTVQLTFVETLVQEHVLHHENDLFRSLISLQLTASERRDLDRITDPDLERTLTTLAGSKHIEETSYSNIPTGVCVGAQTSRDLRFQPIRFHARGGLGEVYVAHDVELNREVALKRIQDKKADDPESRARFLLEAEVTGGLEHPGIVPVYGLGEYADGRPYYAMRFIEGDSLDEAIKRFHGGEGAVRDSAEGALTLRGLLGRLVDVCDTVSYAHSRGVLHRDLKPGNIMVGKYGETIVVDWGLAKLAARHDGRDEDRGTQHRPSPGSSNMADTMPGSVVGTPAYMSPEQAAGDIDRVRVASDVYSLGATLFSILTGRPPVRRSRTNVGAAKGRLVAVSSPRRVKADVPAALDAICVKAMAVRPEDRYVSPRALADDVEHWLADEPVSAWRREPVSARLARWARHHRTLVVGLLITLAAALIASGAGIVFLDAQRKKAEETLNEALTAVDRSYTRVAEDMLSDQPRMEQDQREFLELALVAYKKLARINGPGQTVRFKMAKAAQKLAEVKSLIDGPEAVVGDCRRSADLFRQLAADFPANPEHRRHLAQCESVLGNLPESVVPAVEAEEARQHALALRKRLVHDWPDNDGYRCDLTESYRTIGVLLRKRGDTDEAEEMFREGLKLFTSDPSEYGDKPEILRALSRLHDNLGNLLRLLERPERLEEAQAESQLALTIRSGLVEDRPRSPSRRLELARSHNNLGAIFHQMCKYDISKYENAIENYHSAEKLQTALASDFPHVLTYRQELARTLVNLGDADQERGLAETAEPHYERALGILVRLVDEFPEQPDFRHDKARTHYSLALLHSNRGSVPDETAKRHFLEAVSIEEELVREQPANLEYRYWAAKFNDGLAKLLADKNPTEAAEYRNKAHRHRERVGQARPPN